MAQQQDGIRWLLIAVALGTAWANSAVARWKLRNCRFFALVIWDDPTLGSAGAIQCRQSLLELSNLRNWMKTGVELQQRILRPDTGKPLAADLGLKPGRGLFQECSNRQLGSLISCCWLGYQAVIFRRLMICSRLGNVRKWITNKYAFHLWSAFMAQAAQKREVATTPQQAVTPVLNWMKHKIVVEWWYASNAYAACTVH